MFGQVGDQVDQAEDQVGQGQGQELDNREVEEIFDECIEKPPDVLRLALFQGNNFFMTATEVLLLISWSILFFSGNILIVYKRKEGE